MTPLIVGLSVHGTTTTPLSKKKRIGWSCKLFTAFVCTLLVRHTYSIRFMKVPSPQEEFCDLSRSYTDLHCPVNSHHVQYDVHHNTGWHPRWIPILTDWGMRQWSYLQLLQNAKYSLDVYFEPFQMLLCGFWSWIRTLVLQDQTLPLLCSGISTQLLPISLWCWFQSKRTSCTILPGRQVTHSADNYTHSQWKVQLCGIRMRMMCISNPLKRPLHRLLPSLVREPSRVGCARLAKIGLPNSAHHPRPHRSILRTWHE